MTTTDTPRRYMTVVYEIVDETEWRETNPLLYAHNGLSAVTVCMDDACEKLDEAEAEVERLQAAFSRLADEIECTPWCNSHQAGFCDCRRLERAYAISDSIPQYQTNK